MGKERGKGRERWGDRERERERGVGRKTESSGLLCLLCIHSPHPPFTVTDEPLRQKPGEIPETGVCVL